MLASSSAFLRMTLTPFAIPNQLRLALAAGSTQGGNQESRLAGPKTWEMGNVLPAQIKGHHKRSPCWESPEEHTRVFCIAGTPTLRLAYLPEVQTAADLAPSPDPIRKLLVDTTRMSLSPISLADTPGMPPSLISP